MQTRHRNLRDAGLDGAVVRAALVLLALCPDGAAAQLPLPPLPRTSFQFRVNAVPGETWSGGVDQASVAVKPTGSLSFAWVALSNLLESPACTNLLADCDGNEISPDRGESQSNPNAVVFARDFTRKGLALEPGDTGIDPVLACIGNRRVPSIAAKRVSSSVRGIVSAWDFSWNPILSPCDLFCGDFCFMFFTGTNATAWPSDGPPLPGGPHPGRCNTLTPSVAFSDDASLEAWIDVSTLCSEVWALVEPGGTFQVRGHEFEHHVSLPCAGAGLADRFVVLWNEHDGPAGTTTVRLRRIDGSVLGAIVDVGRTDRSAAVSVFDDGSFAVFWWDTTNGLDPRARLALYSADEPPLLVAPHIDITTFDPLPPQGPANNDGRLTVTVRGANVLATGARALCVWEDHDPIVVGDVEVSYRLVDPVTRLVGKERRFALDRGVPKHLGDSGQHTAVYRPDGTAACVWTGHEKGRPLPDRNVYCTVRVPVF